MTMQRPVALFGCALAILLSLGCAGRPRAQLPATAPDGKPWTRVTVDNYARAKSDTVLKGYVDDGAFGMLQHERVHGAIGDGSAVRAGIDTLESFGVFDLTSPLTITLPETGGRFQSLTVINEDHSIQPTVYGPGSFTFTLADLGTRYAFIGVRTFADANDPGDVIAANALQDRIEVQQAEIGAFEVPYWNPESVAQMTGAMNYLASTVRDTSASFGRKGEIDDVHHMLGTAFGWGGNPKETAVYSGGVVAANDGKVPHTLTVPADAPVDGFWSITVYDAEGNIRENPRGVYSLGSTNATPNPDGSITIHLGGDEDAPNRLPITKGWNYMVRMYRPGAALLDGSWTFPKPAPVQ